MIKAAVIFNMMPSIVVYGCQRSTCACFLFLRGSHSSCLYWTALKHGQ